jgi:hypothetical protein
MAERESSFFDAEFRLRKIDKIGDPLQKLDEVIDREIFRPTLANAFAANEPPKGPRGRPPFDNVLKFKVLILQALYDLSDDTHAMKTSRSRTGRFQRNGRNPKMKPSSDRKTLTRGGRRRMTKPTMATRTT